jgi:hypothetical protein
MNSEERIKYITCMSAAMVTELHELMALEARLQKLESLQCSEQKPRPKFSDGTSRVAAAALKTAYPIKKSRSFFPD